MGTECFLGSLPAYPIDPFRLRGQVRRDTDRASPRRPRKTCKLANPSWLPLAQVVPRLGIEKAYYPLGWNLDDRQSLVRTRVKWFENPRGGLTRRDRVSAFRISRCRHAVLVLPRTSCEITWESGKRVQRSVGEIHRHC
jgi:hypothetical protein